MKTRTKRMVSAFLVLMMVVTALNTEGLMNLFHAANTIIVQNESADSSESESILSEESSQSGEDENLADGQTSENLNENESTSEDPETEETTTETTETTETDLNETSTTEDAIGEAIGDTLIEPEGYHYFNGVLYGNMYVFKYDPNNGDSEYEKEAKGFVYPNEIYSRHFWDNVEEYDGLPVYNILTSHLISGIKDVDFYIDDFTLAGNVFDRNNYEFIEWNTEPDGSGEVYKDRQSIHNNYSENLYEQTLYAQWEISKAAMTILKNGGIFSMEEFISLNDLEGLSQELKETDDGLITIFTYEDGTTLEVEETESKIVFTQDCLTTLTIPDMKSDNESVAFVGYETSSSNYDSQTKEYFFVDKNAKPALKALFLSDLELQGNIDLTGYNGSGSVFLSWGTNADDDIDKVYKIAQSLDGENFEYIPDQNLTDLIEGRKYLYTGDVQTFTAPVTGKYYIEAYGANGGIGYFDTYRPGYGGRTSGYVNLTKGQTIYIYVGEAGRTYPDGGTYRTYGGGGAAPVKNKIWNNGQINDWKNHAQGRGGGATYISLTDKEMSEYIPENYESIPRETLYKKEAEAAKEAKENILMLAAGGGGVSDTCQGGNGGGLSGEGTVVSHYHYGSVNKWTASGATQTSAGQGDFGTLNGMMDDFYYRSTTYGTFFYGANGMTCSGAAGGGWFGGGMCYVTGGSGGSSYLGESLGLYDCETVAGGNKDNNKDASKMWNVNGSVNIKVCEYWITTNTAENVYSPDEAAPSTPSNIDVSLDENQNGIISWDASEDFGTKYWYRVDAFEAENHDNKLSETEVQMFDIISDLKGYLYVIDDKEYTEAHEGNATLTTDTFITEDILDVEKPKYLHISAVDNAGNTSETVTVLLNKATVVVDPNKKGSYEGSREPKSYILDALSDYKVKELIPDEDDSFIGWKKTTGDGTFNEESQTVTLGYQKTTITADYMAELILSSKPNTEANSKKGAVDLSWIQDDSLAKKYKLYQSLNKEEWYDAAVVSNTGGNYETSFEYDASSPYYTYTVPYNGVYTLTVSGSKGGNYGSSVGGNGSTISGDFSLKRGDVLYIYCGAEGVNGGGTGTYGKGGGATDIRLNGTELSDRIIAAAGGGAATNGNNGKAETANQQHNNTLGNGSNGSAGGGGGWFGGSAGGTDTGTTNKRLTFNDNTIIQVPVAAVTGPWGSGWYFHTIPSSFVYDGVLWTVETQGAYMVNYYYTKRTTTQPLYYFPGQGGFIAFVEGSTSTANGNGNNGTFNFRGDVPYTIYTQANAGVSRVDQNRGLFNSVYYGSNSGAGKATISFDQSAIGELQENSISGVIATDMAAPNAPYSGMITSKETATAVLSWNAPEDNGTVYYHKAESYLDGTEDLLRISNITEDLIVSGIHGYRYYADTNSTGTVNAGNSDFISTNQLSVSVNDLSKYYHVAAVDYAGNIGPTYTFQPMSASNVTVKVIWEDDKNADNTRPMDNVAVSLYRNGTEVKTENLSSYSDMEEITFTDLPIVDGSGNLYSYTAKITGVTSQNERFAYDTSYSSNQLVITNSLRTLTKNIVVEVQWEDDNNALDTRPDEITVSIVDEEGNVIAQETVPSTEKEIIFEVFGDPDYKVVIGDVDSKVEDTEYVASTEQTGDDRHVIVNTLKYCLKVDPNGGFFKNSTDIAVYKEYAGTVIDLPAPVRQGYDFKGWEIEGEDIYTEDSFTMRHSNTTLKAKWEASSLTLTINPNGGRYDSSFQIQTFKMTYGTKKIIDVPQRTGYTFTGWSLIGNGSYMPSFTVKSMFTMGYEDAMLTATWKKNSIAVSFDAQGGTVSPDKKTVVFEEAYGTLPIPDKTGYEFLGWTSDKEGKNDVTEETIVMNPENHTLYAQYITKKTTLSGKVVWIDENNKYGSRPDSLNISILSDGEHIQHMGDQIVEGGYTESFKDEWTFFKENIQEYNLLTGKAIDYSVVLNPEPAPSVNRKYAYRTEYKKEADGSFTITNTMYLATKTIEGTVKWEDKSNAYGSRPETVTVDLYQDGKKIDSVEAAGNGDLWTYSFPDNLIFREDGYVEYEYTVKVNPDPTPSMNTDDAYETTINGYHITEKLVNNNKKVIDVTISWVDDNNRWNYRPDEVTVELWKGNEKVDSVVVPSDEENFLFENLPKYDEDLNLIDYSLKEVIDAPYEVDIEKTEMPNGQGGTRFDIVNTFTPPEPVKPVKPSASATLQMRVVYENEDDIKALGLSKEDLRFTATLQEMTKVFTGENGVYDISYENTPTGNEVKAVLSDEYVAIIGLTPGKYKIDVSKDYLFHLVEILEKQPFNITLIKEDGEYYITMDCSAEESSSYIDVVLSAKRNGYSSRQYFNNLFAGR